MKKLRPHKVDWVQIERFIASADKKLASAHKILAFDEQACLQQAHEAMLKASLFTQRSSTRKCPPGAGRIASLHRDRAEFFLAA
jgi:hypothetical protein